MLQLPPAPAHQSAHVVKAWSEAVVMPTYRPAPADRNPMFLEKRVYQGSSGRVYPMPCIDRIADAPVPQAWEAVHLENEYVRVMVLPQLGGRIHVGLDKTNGYDFFYRQNVIKPALVGLAGPWCSGGVEFNWPQHHRPATCMPASVEIERHDDGSVTAWCSDHDPMTRMQGTHGVRLRPGSAAVELHVRLHNRTDAPQTFLWWANVATRVHDHYQSFFPPEVSYVADHAKRAMSTFPLASGRYYGVDYAARAAEGPHADGVRRDDLTWYRNIPVPTSYMILGTEQDFFGGYDHAARAGLVHVADHHQSPGKKQWTWGNHPFGYAWDRHLTDGDGPYIELMAGVFTDNQPDFSHLAPGELRTFTQCWYPIQGIGPAHAADATMALHLSAAGTAARCGVAVTRALSQARVTLTARGRVLAAWTRDLAPGRPLVEEVALPPRLAIAECRLAVAAGEDGRELLAYQPTQRVAAEMPAAATEPPLPDAIPSTDELIVTAAHLSQYRHATRSPVPYWQEALRRDPGDSRAHLGLGRWRLDRGEWTEAEGHLRAAIARLTLRNPNPADGEPHYQLGRCLRLQERLKEADDAFAKACWVHAWQGPAHHARAELAARRGDWVAARDQVERSLAAGAGNLRAAALRVMALRRLGRDAQAAEALATSRRSDPLDAWSCWLAGLAVPGGSQIRLDLALDLARAGCDRDAIAVLADVTPEPEAGTGPLMHACRAWLLHRLGDPRGSARELDACRAACPDHCFPARLEELPILEWVAAADPRNGAIRLALGNWLYDRRRHREAIARWREAVAIDPANAVAWRNLGIGEYNVLARPSRASTAYARAIAAAPDDARLRYERDQLWKRIGVSPRRRLAALAVAPALIARRDDLTVEYAHLLCQAGRHAEAVEVLAARRFQPWEGGEGLALGAWRRAHLALGRAALAIADTQAADRHARAVEEPPESLGEAWHLLQNLADVRLLRGDIAAAHGDQPAARAAWTAAAESHGDFQEMSVRAYSELTLAQAEALRRLGRGAAARRLLTDLRRHADGLRRTEARIDYFATSLPTMLLFEDDLQARQDTTARFLAAQADLGLGRRAAALRGLRAVLARDPSHAGAADLLAAADGRAGRR